MDYMNFDSSSNEYNNSKERLNHISYRIRRLENDIKEIKSKEKEKEKGSFSFFSPNKKYNNNNNHIKTIEEYNPKREKKYKNDFDNLLKNNLLYKSVTINNSYSNDKNKNKKIYQKKKCFNKLNNSNNIILDKKNFVLKKNNQMNKIPESSRYMSPDNNVNNIKNKQKNNNGINKIRNVFSFKELYTNNTENRISHKNKIKNYNYNNNYNNRENLEYEFEIRNLKKRLNLLIKENKAINAKLGELKIINKDLENNIFQNEEEQKILNDIIILNKQYMLYNNQSGLENEMNEQNNINSSFNNIILNIMDIKFDFDNNLLKDEFINGINKLFNLPLNINRDNNKNLMKKINQLIDNKNNLNNNINKYKYQLKENNKIHEYFESLISYLNLNNISELDPFIKNLYIKNIKENKHMKKIKNTLMNDSSSSKPKKVRKNHYFSSNRIVNSYSQTIEKNNKYNRLKNFLNSKKSDSRINQKKINYYMTNRRKYNNLNPKIFNRTEKIDNFDNNYIINFQNQENNNEILPKNSRKNNSLIFSEIRQNNYLDKRKKNIINLNYYDKRNNNNNVIKNKNKLFNTEEDMEDIKYFDNINNFNKNYYGHVKNHSVIIFNK